MCCLATFLVKYVLFGANLIFTLAGIGLIGVGTAVIVQLSDVVVLLPAVVKTVAIAIIVLGCIIFLIAFFGCCGAIRESRCLLGMYSACMAILAGAMIYICVIVFRMLGDITNTVANWIETAFGNNDLRQAFHVLEALFECCGTSGPGSYQGVLPSLPPSCCPQAAADQTCVAANAFQGCTPRMTSYFEVFGEGIGGVIIAIIIVELVAMIFGLFLCSSIANRRSRQTY